MPAVSQEKFWDSKENIIVLQNSLKKNIKKNYCYEEKQHIFATDWINQFKSWNLPISLYRNEINALSSDAEKFEKEFFLKVLFENCFGGPGRCKKIITQFKLKDKATPVFKPKKNVPFSALQAVNNGLDRLEKWVVLKRNHSEIAQSAWAVEYTDCIFAKTVRLPPQLVSRIGSQQSDGEAGALGNAEYLFIAIASLPWSGGTYSVK